MRALTTLVPTHCGVLWRALVTLLHQLCASQEDLLPVTCGYGTNLLKLGFKISTWLLQGSEVDPEGSARVTQAVPSLHSAGA